MCSLSFSKKIAAKIALMLCVLTLAASGCVSSAALTNVLPPAPRMPGAVVSNDFVCLPHAEAAELLLWVEHAEEICR